MDKRKGVTYLMFLNWKSDLDWKCQTISQLACDVEPRQKRVVSRLLCSVCIGFPGVIWAETMLWKSGMNGW